MLVSEGVCQLPTRLNLLFIINYYIFVSLFMSFFGPVFYFFQQLYYSAVAFQNKLLNE